MKLFCLILTTTTLQYQFLNLVEFSSSLCPVLIYIHIILEILSLTPGSTISLCYLLKNEIC